jgi:hypothetical protein
MSAEARLRDPKKLGSKTIKETRMFRARNNLASGGARPTPQKQKLSGQARLANQKSTSSEVRTTDRKECSSKKTKGASLLLAQTEKLGN